MAMYEGINCVEETKVSQCQNLVEHILTTAF